MDYTSNPRKIYGKVKIVYADSEISMDLANTTSGNGEISSPEQVYQGHLSPTIKACTMDGNSTMGGGYQMNDKGLITGWWSDVHCDSNGIFASPPWIKVTFISRPIIKWIIRGDDKLGQYPKDFDIELFQGEKIVDKISITENNSLVKEIKYQPPYNDITAIKLTVNRWNAPNAKAKILQFFDIVEEEYLGADIKSFEVLEELSKNSDTGYGINSDTATFALLNKDRKFDKGYLKALALLNRKVIPYIGVETSNGDTNYTAFGTFYSDDWNIPQNDVWVKLKCVDKLMSLQKKIYLGYPFATFVSLYEITRHILNESGFSDNQIRIDDNLKQDIVECAFMQKSSSWDALQSVCYAGLCNAYINREDILVVEKEKQNPTQIIIGTDRIFSLDKSTKTTDFCNYVEVNYTEVVESTTVAIAYESVITFEPNKSKTLVMDYACLVSSPNMTMSPSLGLEIVSFDSGTNAGKFTIKNNTNGLITSTVKVQGNVITTRTQTVSASEEKSIDAWGIKEFIYSNSELIQSYDKASEIAEILLSKLNQNNGSIGLSWRGDPSLKLQDTFIVTDRFGDNTPSVVQSNQYKYDGSLIQITKSKLI